MLASGHSAEVADHAGGTIRTFGSFRLGVNNKSGDIDLLILAPVYVNREHFFDSFAAILKEHKVSHPPFRPPRPPSRTVYTELFAVSEYFFLWIFFGCDANGLMWCLQEVDDLNLVPEAYVPAIKLEFMGIEMDLLFAQLTQTSVPEDIELMNVDLLRNLDDKSVRSVI